MTIRDEADFIHKVKNKYHRRVNNEMATKIQAAARGWIVRQWYKNYRMARMFLVIKIQSIFKRKMMRKKYLRDLEARKQKSAQLI